MHGQTYIKLWLPFVPAGLTLKVYIHQQNVSSISAFVWFLEQAAIFCQPYLSDWVCKEEIVCLLRGRNCISNITQVSIFFFFERLQGKQHT